MLRFSMTHPCSHLGHNHAQPVLQGHLWDSRERGEATGSRSQLAQKALSLSRRAGGEGGGVSCSLGKVWNLELKSPITNPEKILSIEIFITVFAEKRIFIKDWIVFAFNTKIRSTFVNKKKFRRILFTQQALPYMQSPITTFFIFVTHKLTKRMLNE